MATENEGWDTSTAHIRRTFEACIEHGRRAQGREGDDLWEAYRLLGTGLHTLEDLLAHSNWCELALRKMGHSEVFCHVGDDGKLSYIDQLCIVPNVDSSACRYAQWQSGSISHRHIRER